MGSQTMPKCPVVEFTKDLKPGSSCWVSTCNDVKNALEDYGFFAAVYDGVPAELSGEVFQAIQELMSLPLETKTRNVADIYHLGYIGNDPNVPLYESMGTQDATSKKGVEAFTNLMWPQGNDHFCETMQSYGKRVSELDQLVKRMIFDSYGVEKYYEFHIKSTDYMLRYMSYGAPQVVDEAPSRGVPAHTDRTVITILHQNQVNGLEMKTKDGEWFAVEFPPSSFIVIAGDALMGWSNGRVHAPIHRVKVNGNKARYTIGLFSHIKGIIEVPEELVDDEHPLLYKPFDNIELLRFGTTEEGRRAENVLKAYCGV